MSKTLPTTQPDADETGGCCGGAVSWMASDTATDLSTRLSAVADPIRLQILSIIGNAPTGEVCACDFVEPLGKSQPTISHHLKVLTEAGFIEGDRRGRWIWYRLNPVAMATVATSLGKLAEGIT